MNNKTNDSKGREKRIKNTFIQIVKKNDNMQEGNNHQEWRKIRGLGGGRGEEGAEGGGVGGRGGGGKPS